MSEGGVVAKPIPSLKGSATTQHPERVGLWKFKAQCRQSILFFWKENRNFFVVIIYEEYPDFYML